MMRARLVLMLVSEPSEPELVRRWYTKYRQLQTSR